MNGRMIVINDSEPSQITVIDKRFGANLPAACRKFGLETR